MWQEPFRAVSLSPGAGAGPPLSGALTVREGGASTQTHGLGPRLLLAVPPTRSALRTGLLWRFEASAFSLWPRLEACGI